MDTDSRQQERTAWHEHASETPYWSLVLAHAWVQGMAPGQVPYQKQETPLAAPSVVTMPTPDTGSRGANSKFSQELQVAALSWEIARQSQRPELEWVTHYRREDYPAWVPVKIPGSTTTNYTPDHLLILCPSQALGPMLQAASSLLLLRPCGTVSEPPGTRLDLPTGVWLTIVQGRLTVKGILPMEDLPVFPLTSPNASQALQPLAGFNQAWELAKMVLPKSPMWHPVPRDPRHPWDY